MERVSAELLKITSLRKRELEEFPDPENPVAVGWNGFGAFCIVVQSKWGEMAWGTLYLGTAWCSQSGVEWAWGTLYLGTVEAYCNCMLVQLQWGGMGSGLVVGWNGLWALGIVVQLKWGGMGFGHFLKWGGMVQGILCLGAVVGYCNRTLLHFLWGGRAVVNL
eukprot:1162116-Pelagomonas_calceolata.AAC.2